MNRVRCSDWVTENQNLVRWMPLSTSIRSNSGAWRMNCSYSSSVAKPITRSTPARLYQERSNSTISPGGRQVLRRSAGSTTGPARGRVGLVKRDDPRVARVQVLHEALDRAALAGGVAALEERCTCCWPVVDWPSSGTSAARPAAGTSAASYSSRSSARRTGSSPATCRPRSPSGSIRIGSSSWSSPTVWPSICSRSMYSRTSFNTGVTLRSRDAPGQPPASFFVRQAVSPPSQPVPGPFLNLAWKPRPGTAARCLPAGHVFGGLGPALSPGRGRG